MRFNFKEAALKNWPIKLAALILATVLWAAVAAVEPTEELVPVRLLVEPPPGRTLTDPPPEVLALYQGSPRQLIKLFASPPVVRKIVPDTVSASEWVLELSTQDLVTTEVSGVQAQDIQPRVIRLRLGDMATRRVPVVARVELEPDSGFAIVGDAMVDPDSVTITGPREPVGRISRVFTSRMRMTGLTESISVPVALDTTPLGIVRTEQSQVTVSAQVSRITERVLMGIPVTVGGLRGGLWESSPPGVAVTVRGPARRLARIARDSVQVSVTSPVGVDSATVLVTVTVPKGLTAEARPDRVLLRRRGSG
jgi:YbbR domain-containing protein